MLNQQARDDFQDEKMKDALNYANLIQNVENIGRLNNYRNQPISGGLAAMPEKQASGYSGKELRTMGTMPVNHDEKSQWLIYEK